MSVLSLGIDTSNYTTSVALVDENENILYNRGILLEVKSGERGLRQSDALFQHINNLPLLLEELTGGRAISVICYSNQPRPLPDSYMPVFKAGEAVARSLGGILGVRILGVSHQENHIRAAIYGSGSPELEERFCAVHFSGGTSEILLATKQENGYGCEIIAETLDLNAGQLIDRIGVQMGCSFPAGRALEVLAREGMKDLERDKWVIASSMEQGDFHFSGQENQARKLLGQGVNKEVVAFLLLKSVAKTLVKSIRFLKKKQAFQSVLFSGGVMSNLIIKDLVINELKGSGLKLHFSEGAYSRDNALGNALMGMDFYRQIQSLE